MCFALFDVLLPGEEVLDAYAIGVRPDQGGGFYVHQAEVSALFSAGLVNSNTELAASLRPHNAVRYLHGQGGE